MNFIQRAIKNVTRGKTKSILLLVTFFAIGNFVIIGLGVSAASENAKTLTRQKMRAVVTMNIDYDAIWRYADTIEDEDELQEFYKNYPSITLADVNALLGDSRVKTANACSTDMVYMAAGETDFVHLGNQAEENNMYVYDPKEYENRGWIEAAFTIKANYFPSMIEFEDNMWQIVDGRFYTEEEITNASPVVVISEALANANGIGVGDSITVLMSSPEAIYNNWYEGMNIVEDDLRATFEVVGIYQHNSPITPDNNRFDWASPYENLDNMLLMPGTTYQMSYLPFQQKVWDYNVEKYPDEEYYQNEENRPGYQMEKISLYDVTLLLNDPLEVDDFVKEYKSNLGEFKKITADNGEFENLSKPLDTLSFYAKFIVGMVVVNAVIIISLVTALTLKTREYEIGVLLAIGASKLKVIGQFFIELAIVAILGFTLSVGSGSLIAHKVGETVLGYQIASSGLNEEEEYVWDDGYIDIWNTNYSTDVSLDDLISEYDVSISPVIIAEIYVVGLGIVLISTMIPSMMIMRFNPKRILTNQG